MFYQLKPDIFRNNNLVQQKKNRTHEAKHKINLRSKEELFEMSKGNK